MRHAVWIEVRAPLPQGDRADIDQSRGLWDGGAGVRGQYVDDGRGIRCHHPSTVRLSAAAIRFRRVYAVNTTKRLFMGYDGVTGMVAREEKRIQ